MPNVAIRMHRIYSPRLDLPPIHIHNTVRLKPRQRQAPRPKMVDQGTQYRAEHVADPSDPRRGAKARLRRLKHRVIRGLGLLIATGWTVLLFYARRITIGVSACDALLGARRR